MNRRALVLCLLLVVVLVGAGVAYDRHRARVRQRRSQTAKLPVFGSLLPVSEDAEISGVAKCGFCYWGEGGKSCNTVLQTSVAPGVVFVLPNETRSKIEKMTGECAGGDYSITARGVVTQYNGRNYLLAKSFTAAKLK